MYHLILMKVNKTFQNLFDVGFDYRLGELSLLLVNTA
jgi:hypothetical protein